MFALAGCSGLNADKADNESAPASEAPVASVAETDPVTANEQKGQGQQDHASPSGEDANGANNAAGEAAVTVTGATASSPYHIMLFHQGEYLGTATVEPYGFAPEITRASGRQVDVTYRWPQDGDANANPTGSSFASFAWNPVAEEIEMAGNVPPA
ncbi:LppP/LprE family lipoprotein [Corynebacterium sp. 32222D000AT]